MTAALPVFPYHPDPFATGSVIESDAECPCCRQARGASYTGPVFTAERLDGELCPWCIADGSAASRFDAVFTDIAGVDTDGVPDEVLDEVATRTPGYSGWQQETWMFHCDDAATYLGRAGYDELRRHPDALAQMRAECRSLGWDDAQVDALVHALHPDGHATAYLFRCRHCEAHLARWDST